MIIIRRYKYINRERKMGFISLFYFFYSTILLFIIIKKMATVCAHLATHMWSLFPSGPSIT